jgi:hypothetical protein
MLTSPSICSLVAAINCIAMGVWFCLTFACLGSELYSRVTQEPEMQGWINYPNIQSKMEYPLSQEMLSAIDRFFFNHYCLSFRSGAFARANSSMYVWLSVCLMGFILRSNFKPHAEYAR